MKNYKTKEDSYKKAKIKEENGLNIDYDKKELDHFFPHLITEISEKKKIVKIDSINHEIDKKENNNGQNQSGGLPNELINPDVHDFLRRCTTNEEAFEILEFLLKRKELNFEDYKKFKERISQDGGLKQLIEENGGVKMRGYFLDKYYKKDKDQKLK